MPESVVPRPNGPSMRMITLLAIVAATALPALADGAAFVGPAGWSSSGTPTGGDPAHPTLLQWHLPGDSAASVTYLHTTTSYDDSLAAIHTNFTTNHIRPALDKDLPCQGKTGHVVEFSFGPDDHKIVINRILLPAPDGVVTITYSRADGTPFDAEVQKSEATFCAATP